MLPGTGVDTRVVGSVESTVAVTSLGEVATWASGFSEGSVCWLGPLNCNVSGQAAGEDSACAAVPCISCSDCLLQMTSSTGTSQRTIATYTLFRKAKSTEYLTKPLNGFLCSSGSHYRHFWPLTMCVDDYQEHFLLKWTSKINMNICSACVTSRGNL